MNIQFWGTRGSIAAPGLATARYGGNTACVSVTLTDGTLLILDAGTGIRKLGHVLQQRGDPVSAHLFLSHCHWDHIQGFPFFAPAYDPGTQLSIYGYPAARQKIRKTMSDQMEGAYFPVDFATLSASISFIDMWEDSLSVGTSRIRVIETSHPGGGVGFRVEENGCTFVYLTDNELGDDVDRFVPFCRDASVLVHDAQYTPDEIGTHRGWGHSSYLEVLRLARKARVRRVALFHHEPERTDAQIDALVDECHREMARHGDRFRCEAAAEGRAIDVCAELLSQS